MICLFLFIKCCLINKCLHFYRPTFKSFLPYVFKEILLLFCAQVFLIYVSYIVICAIFLFSPLKLYTFKIHCVMIRTSTLLLLLWIFQDIPAPHFTKYFHVGPFIHQAIYNVINSQNFPSNFPFSSIY